LLVGIDALARARRRGSAARVAGAARRRWHGLCGRSRNGTSRSGRSSRVVGAARDGCPIAATIAARRGRGVASPGLVTRPERRGSEAHSHRPAEERSVGEQSRPGARLEQAFELLLQSPPATRADAERLLAAHPALQDLLGPLLGRAEAPVDDDAQSLGEFRLVRELGRGGMGVVYEGWQRSLGRRVAVKVLAPGLAEHPAAVARFRREAAAAARLRHPHIVEVHDFGTAAGQHYFAMQYVDGVPLHDCMERFRASRPAVGLVAQIADALAHAHEHGLIHRDVKPANVLVRADGEAMLADFGIARDEALPSLTQDGGFLGTLDYASPEQVRGERVDARTDVWSVGVLLYRLVAGQHPFPGTTRASLMHQILVTEPASLRGRPGISDDLAAVIDQALRKERHLRYDSAGALLRDLRALQQGAPVTARLPGTGEKLVRWLRREPWQATAVGALVAGLAASAIGFWQAAERAAAEQVARQQADDALANYDQLAGVVLYDRALAAESALTPRGPTPSRGCAHGESGISRRSTASAPRSRRR
ncbi:MAG: serine/threonine protein kinase, partial [Planctomycetes bacterium]|nr:serine/threonine protein kinase [Planctomycetota bacterium]